MLVLFLSFMPHYRVPLLSYDRTSCAASFLFSFRLTQPELSTATLSANFFGRSPTTVCVRCLCSSLCAGWLSFLSFFAAPPPLSCYFRPWSPPEGSPPLRDVSCSLTPVRPGFVTAFSPALMIFFLIVSSLSTFEPVHRITPPSNVNSYGPYPPGA